MFLDQVCAFLHWLGYVSYIVTVEVTVFHISILFSYFQNVEPWQTQYLISPGGIIWKIGNCFSSQGSGSEMCLTCSRQSINIIKDLTGKTLGSHIDLLFANCNHVTSLGLSFSSVEWDNYIHTKELWWRKNLDFQIQLTNSSAKYRVTNLGLF